MSIFPILLLFSFVHLGKRYLDLSLSLSSTEYLSVDADDHDDDDGDGNESSDIEDDDSHLESKPQDDADSFVSSFGTSRRDAPWPIVTHSTGSGRSMQEEDEVVGDETTSSFGEGVVGMGKLGRRTESGSKSGVRDQDGKKVDIKGKGRMVVDVSEEEDEEETSREDDGYIEK